MVISFVTALTLMLAFIFGSPNVKRYKRDGLSFEESRFYCLHCTYCYISAKLHPVTIHSLPGEEQQWLVRHSFNVGLSEFIDDWLKQSEEFDRVRWYSQEQWNGSKDWLDRPW